MTHSVAQQAKYNFLIAEEYQDFKEFLSYKLNMNSKEFNELYDEFIKWRNEEITVGEIKIIR